ncbi:MAG: hypothetical protein IPM35_37590 [Myxococcales bacterium]|nr:hypothetical protein [Myxococcales bacterium]
MRRLAWLVAILGTAWGACSSGPDAPVCENAEGCGSLYEKQLIAAIDSSLDPGAVMLSSLQQLPNVSGLRARAYERRDGGAVVVLWTKDGADLDTPPSTKKTSAVAVVSASGEVTPLATDRTALSVFQGPPRGTEYRSGAVFVTCETGATTTAWIADPDQGVLESTSEAPFGACNTSNSPVRPMLGRGFDPSRFTAASGQEIGVYSFSGKALQKVATFPPTGSFYAWVEEIEPGVVAWVSWSNLQSNVNGTWTYHRSDTGAGPSFANSASIVLDAYDESGIETVRRQPDGSLLIITGEVKAATSGTGIFRWRVESDGSLTHLGSSPAPPFGEWQALSGFRAVATQFQPNPRANHLQTPVAHAASSFDDQAFSIFRSRNTPCSDDAQCQRIGEAYTLAVVGPAGKRTAIQALWVWANLPAATSGVVVAVPTTETAIPGTPGPDASIDATPIDSGVPDVQDEEGSTAPCPTGCGALGCDPLGGCNAEPIHKGSVVSISAGNGVTWLQRGQTPTSSTLWWIPKGSPITGVTSVASAGQISVSDRVIADDLGAFFHDYSSMQFVALPPSGAPQPVVGSGATPDSLRLVGTTPTHVFIAQTAVPPVAVRRWTRGSWQSELLVCTADWGDGVMDATERVFVATGSSVVRLDGKQQGGVNCQGTNAGVALDSASVAPGVQRLALGSTHLYGLSGTKVFAFDPAGVAAPTEIGAAQTGGSFDTSYPLATTGDAVIYVAPGPLPTTTASYSVVAVESPGAAPHILATSSGWVTAIASDGTYVYFADDRGLVRVPRTQAP